MNKQDKIKELEAENKSVREQISRMKARIERKEGFIEQNEKEIEELSRKPLVRVYVKLDAKAIPGASFNSSGKMDHLLGQVLEPVGVVQRWDGVRIVVPGKVTCQAGWYLGKDQVVFVEGSIEDLQEV